jgi:hypothetical protein
MVFLQKLAAKKKLSLEERRTLSFEDNLLIILSMKLEHKYILKLFTELCYLICGLSCWHFKNIVFGGRAQNFCRPLYFVDTGATLSIVPCTSKTTPSGPPLKGQMDNQSPLGDLLKKVSNSMANFFLRSFCKPLWQVPFWTLTSSESSKSLFPQRPAKYFLLALQRPGLPPNLFFSFIFLWVFVYMYLCRHSEASTQYCVIPGGYPPQD